MVKINPPYELKTGLAKTPEQAPLYYAEWKSPKGRDLKLAKPEIIRALIACMDMNAVLGGAASHFGGPAAFAEVSSALHALAFYEAKKQGKEYYELFHLVNDAGHCENGIYALKAMYGYADLNLQSLKAFRSIKSKLTGHGESHLFPEGVLLSNGPLGSALAQAQGLAVADALTDHKRTTFITISDGASMEGEAKEAFSSIPGLAAKNKLAPFVCILSDNNTKLGGRIDEDAFSMQNYFQSLETQGWKRILVEEGNDLEKVSTALEEAYESAQQNPHQPVLLHLKTIKGIGTKSTAQSASGGHGFPLKNAEELRGFVEEILGDTEMPEEIHSWIEEIENLPAKKATESKVKKEKIQVGISQAMIKKYQEGYPLFSVSADLAGSTGVKAFQKEFPDAHLDIGVAEANMISLAAGLSKSGFIPIVDTFAQFGVTKGALPTTMANLSQAPFIGVFSHTGFQDAADGASHQALSYIAMTASIPNVEVYTLSCSSEAEALFGQAIENFQAARKSGRTPKTTIFFLGRENFPQYYKEKCSYELGRAQVLLDSSDLHKKAITIMAVGSTVPQTLEAAKQLEQDGIGVSVLHASCITEPDTESLAPYLKKTKNQLLIVEDHQERLGFASILLQNLNESRIACEAKVLAVRSRFGQSAYTATELYQKHGLGADSILQEVKERLM